MTDNPNPDFSIDREADAPDKEEGPEAMIRWLQAFPDDIVRNAARLGG
jgi:hypothetical protein